MVMKKLVSVLNNENGSPLVIVVLILVLLTLIGLSVLNTTTVETEIAAHDRRHKMTFYGADGGTEVVSELLEQNLGCPTGFTDNTGGSGAVSGVLQFDGGSIGLYRAIEIAVGLFDLAFECEAG